MLPEEREVTQVNLIVVVHVHARIIPGVRGNLVVGITHVHEVTNLDFAVMVTIRAYYYYIQANGIRAVAGIIL
jgi:hypothetical protein